MLADEDNKAAAPRAMLANGIRPTDIARKVTVRWTSFYYVVDRQKGRAMTTVTERLRGSRTGYTQVSWSGPIHKRGYRRSERVYPLALSKSHRYPRYTFYRVGQCREAMAKNKRDRNQAKAEKEATSNKSNAREGNISVLSNRSKLTQLASFDEFKLTPPMRNSLSDGVAFHEKRTDPLSPLIIDHTMSAEFIRILNDIFLMFSIKKRLDDSQAAPLSVSGALGEELCFEINSRFPLHPRTAHRFYDALEKQFKDLFSQHGGVQGTWGSLDRRGGTLKWRTDVPLHDLSPRTLLDWAPPTTIVTTDDI